MCKKYSESEYLSALKHFNLNMQKIEIEKNVKYLNTITPLDEYDALGGYKKRYSLLGYPT